MFGCDAYAHIPKAQQGKFDKNSRKMMFVGYNAISIGYKLYGSKSYVITVRKDVVFDELANWYKDKVDDIDAYMHVNLPNEASTLLARSSSEGSNVCPWSGRLRHENGSTSNSALDKRKKKVEGIGIIGYESSGLESLE